MWNITLICVGKLKEKFYLGAVQEYQKRLQGRCKFNLVELPEERLPETPSPAQIQTALEKEGQRILAHVPKNAALVAMCIEGTLMSSEKLAQQLTTWSVRGKSALCFVIGGSYGLSPQVKQNADLRLSMSPMTFPHHLARVMVLEQLYRAFQINEGTRYHK